MSILRLQIAPDEASVLAILAQEREQRATAKLSEFKVLTHDLSNQSMQIARLLFGELSAKKAKPQIKEAASWLNEWVNSLRSSERTAHSATE